MKTEEIVLTIAAIVASPRVDQYKFGLTMNPPRRRQQYLGVEFEHFVVLDAWLSYHVALNKEQEVFAALTNIGKADRRSALFRKYHQLSRDKTTARSLGGKRPNSRTKYYLYIAWWNKSRKGKEIGNGYLSRQT